MSSIDLQVTATIAKVSVFTKQKDDVVRRICKLTLSREFDSVIAAAMGKDAQSALEALEARGLSEVKIPIDGITAQGTLVCGTQKAVIPVMRGVQAVAKASADDGEDFPPSVKLEFEFDFHVDSWIFLGRNFSAWADVTIVSLQPNLPGLGAVAQPRAGA